MLLWNLSLLQPHLPGSGHEVPPLDVCGKGGDVNRLFWQVTPEYTEGISSPVPWLSGTGVQNSSQYQPCSAFSEIE